MIRTSLASVAISVVLMLHLVALAVAVGGGDPDALLVAELVGLAGVCGAWPPEPPPDRRPLEEAAAAQERDRRQCLGEAILDALRALNLPLDVRTRLIQALTLDALAGGAP